VVNKKAWLDKLYYEIGKQQYDFRLASLTKFPDGSVLSSKWKTYSQLIFPLDVKQDSKIDSINNREILPNEVVVDLEEKENINAVIKKLKQDNLPFYVFDTFSRGYHVHIFFKTALTKDEKLLIIQRYGGDEQKAHQGTVIALEFATHYKSNKIKSLVFKNE